MELQKQTGISNKSKKYVLLTSISSRDSLQQSDSILLSMNSYNNRWNQDV